jgi:hypothetical protein
VHRDNRGHLRHQACPVKFKNIIKPLFKCKKRLPRKSPPVTQLYVGGTRKFLRDWTDPNVLVDRLNQLEPEDIEFNEIIEELRRANIIE